MDRTYEFYKKPHDHDGHDMFSDGLADSFRESRATLRAVREDIKAGNVTRNDNGDYFINGCRIPRTYIFLAKL